MNKQYSYRSPQLLRALQQSPSAAAEVAGSPDYPDIHGRVSFRQTPFGVLVSAEISGLPSSDPPCGRRVFAFHIHEGTSCTGNASDPFSDALTHYNPNRCEHPRHAGDLPPLLENDGYAFSVFLTDRFSVDEVIGRTVIIHAEPDDFTTQPSGNAGKKIVCGVIEQYPSHRHPCTC